MSCVNKGLLLVALSTMSLPTWALDTDDAGTVAKSAWELELTTDQARDEQGGVTSKQHSSGLALTYGLADTVDLGVGLSHVHGDGASGLGDTKLGLKWRFYEKDGLSFAIAPALTLPTGDDEKGLGTGKAWFGVNFITTQELADGWNVHANASWDHLDFKDQATKDASNLDLWRLTTAVDKAITQEWSAGAEVEVHRAAEKADSENPVFAALELVYAPSEAMEFSAGYRFGLNDVETDHTFLFGGTFKW